MFYNYNQALIYLLIKKMTIQPISSQPESFPSATNSTAIDVAQNQQPHDADFLVFKQYAEERLVKRYPYQEVYFPIIEWFKVGIMEFLLENFLIQEKRIISQFIEGRSNTSMNDIEYEYYRLIGKYKKTHSPTALIKFLEHGEKIIKQYRPEALKNNPVYESAIKLFRLNRLDLLNKDLHYFTENTTPYLELDSGNKIVLEMKALRHVSRGLMRFIDVREFTKSKLEEQLKKLKCESSLNFNSPIEKNCNILAENPTLKPEEKKEIQRVFQSTYFQFKQHWKDFQKAQEQFFSKGFFTDSTYAIGCETAFAVRPNGPMLTKQHVEALAKNTNWNDPEQCKLYITRFIDMYSTFLPHVKEISQFIYSHITVLKEEAAFLKDFHLYLRMGNLNQLQILPNQMDKVIVVEVATFSKNLSTDRRLLMRLGSLFVKGDMKELLQFRAVFTAFESYFDEYLLFNDFLLTSTIAVADTYQQEIPVLLLSKYNSVKQHAEILLSEKSHIKPSPQTAKSQKKPEKIPDAAPTPDTLDTQPTDLNDNSVLNPIAPVNIFQTLQDARSDITQWFTQLSKGCTAFGTHQALADAASHYDELLCIMRRFLEQSKQPLSRQALAVFIVSCINHGCLATEQTLSALEREGNHISTPKELSSILSHDLLTIFLNCPLPAGSISPLWREWIKNSSSGVVWVRELNTCKIGSSPLETLLAKTRLFAEGNEALSATNLIRDLLKFLDNAIVLNTKLQHQICVAKGAVLSQEYEATCYAFKHNMRTVFKNIADTSLSISSTSSSHPNISALRNLLGSKKLGMQVEHLLTYLDVEMQQPYLNPYEARLHLRTILRFNQVLMEKILRILLGEIKPDAYFEKEDHDLSVMVVELGLSEKDFLMDEWAWLNQGRSIHQITRYMRAYDSIPKKRTKLMETIERAFHMASQISEKQAMTYQFDLTQNFQIANPEVASKLETVKAAAQYDVDLVRQILEKIFISLNYTS